MILYAHRFKINLYFCQDTFDKQFLINNILDLTDA